MGIIAEKQHNLASTACLLHADSTRSRHSGLQVYGVHVVPVRCPPPNLSPIDELPLTGRSYMYISSPSHRTNQEKLRQRSIKRTLNFLNLKGRLGATIRRDTNTLEQK